jgi:hypothetical protein
MVEELRATIAGLGELLGVAGLALDEDGECALEAGGLMLHLAFFEDAGVLVAYADLGPVARKGELAVCRLLLAGNLSWRETAGGSLAIHPELHRAGLVVRLDVEDLTPAELHERLRDLIEAGTLWLERLDELRGDHHQDHDQDAGHLDPRHLSPIRG